MNAEIETPTPSPAQDNHGTSNLEECLETILEGYQRH